MGYWSEVGIGRKGVRRRNLAAVAGPNSPSDRASVIASNPGRPALLAIVVAALLALTLSLAARAEAFIYWTDGGDEFMRRANLDGSRVDPDFDFFELGKRGGSGVAVDVAHIYWGAKGGIGRANLDGSGAQEGFITTLEAVPGVAVDGEHIYWANPGIESTVVGIGRANLDGSGVEQSFIPITRGNAQGVAVDGAHVYWTTYPDVIGRANLDGSGVQEKFITGLSQPVGVAVDGGHIYWVNSGTGTIGRANLDGSGVEQSFITTNGALEIAIDAAHLYWTDPAGLTGGIGRANLDGSGVEPDFMTFAAGGGYVYYYHPVGIAVDGLSGGADCTKLKKKVTKAKKQLKKADSPQAKQKAKKKLKKAKKRLKQCLG